jgi:integrase
MTLHRAVVAHVDGLSLRDGENSPHKQQGKIILFRLANWLDPLPSPSPLNVADLTVPRLDKFLRYRLSQPGQKGQLLSLATINKEIRYINAFTAWVAEDPIEWGLPSPWRVPTLRKRNEHWHMPRYLTAEQLVRVFDSTKFAKRPQIDGISPQEWWETLFLVAFTTSMRRGALFGVPRPTETDLQAKRLILPARLDKSRRDRVYPLTPLVCARIRRLPCRPGEPMFRWYDAQGRPTTSMRSMYHVMESFQKQAGISAADQSRLHVLRKSTVTHMLQQGAEPTTVQRQTGHSDLKVIMEHYAGELSDLQRAAVERLFIPPLLSDETEIMPAIDPDEPDPIASD